MTEELSEYHDAVENITIVMDDINKIIKDTTNEDNDNDNEDDDDENVIKIVHVPEAVQAALKKNSDNGDPAGDAEEENASQNPSAAVPAAKEKKPREKKASDNMGVSTSNINHLRIKAGIHKLGKTSNGQIRLCIHSFLDRVIKSTIDTYVTDKSRTMTLDQLRTVVKGMSNGRYGT